MSSSAGVVTLDALPGGGVLEGDRLALVRADIDRLLGVGGLVEARSRLGLGDGLFARTEVGEFDLAVLIVIALRTVRPDVVGAREAATRNQIAVLIPALDRQATEALILDILGRLFIALIVVL